MAQRSCTARNRRRGSAVRCEGVPQGVRDSGTLTLADECVFLTSLPDIWRVIARRAR